MTSPQWQKVDALLDQAMELPTAERAAFLDRECNGDTALRREVESLLRAHDGASGFFDSGPVSIAEDLIQNRQAEAMAGRTVGRYQLTREIGRGGMGVVYEAFRADDQFRQKVAIKLLWPGMNNSEIARRFRHERQILANLDHPNIARLLDGGVTEDGLPYFAMEFIEGEPITDYCNAHKLPIAERLKLFQQVCSAVQYAHQNLIIHRDLKPGNILVTPPSAGDAGTAKLLDFGIAKLLDPSRHAITAQPTTNALMMTPDYASPEQMRGEVITTASDVYSLGILLYELLTGGHPYQIKDRSLPELVRVVCEQEPEAPSQRVGQFAKLPHALTETKPERLRAQLRGDLDQITQTAIQKDPSVRYRSVEQLSEDLRRHLEGLPITARTISLSYRTRKFVRRNRVGVLAAALIFLTLLGGIVATARQAHIAQTERNRAEQQAAEAGRQKAFAETQAVEALRQKTLAETKGKEAEENSARAEEQQFLAEQQKNLAENQAESNRRLLYAAQMNLAGQAWDINNIRRLKELIGFHWPQSGKRDLRGFEWYYLWRLANGNGKLWEQDNDAGLYHSIFLSDGKKLAVGTDEGAILLWDAGTGKRLVKIKAHTRHIRYLAVSPDGQKLASAAADATAKLWDLATGRELMTLKGHQHWVTSVAFSPDGKTLATGSRDGTWRMWEVDTGRELKAVQSLTPWVNALAFSPDGKTLATGLGGAPTIKLWDAGTGKEIMAFAGQGSIWSLAFSPDGKRLVTGSKDRTVKIWDLQAGRELVTLNGHAGEVRTVAFSPDGRIVASGADDRLVKFWDSISGAESAVLKEHFTEVTSLAFSPDGSRLMTGEGGGLVRVWDVPRATEFSLVKSAAPQPAAGRIHSLAFSPDGKVLVTGGKEAKLWDVSTGQEIATFKAHKGDVIAVAFAPDGKTIATASSDSQVKLWDSRTKQELLTFAGHAGQVTTVCFSPDSKRIFSGDIQQFKSNGVIWDAATGRELLSLGHFTRKASYSPSGRWIAAVIGPTPQEVKPRLFNASTGQELRVFPESEGGVTGLTFSPDERVLAIGDANGSINLWDVSTAHLLTSLTGHSGLTGAIAFSPDGSRIVTGGPEGLVRLWDIENKVELLSFRGHTDRVTSVAFSPNGQILVSASYDGTVRFWRAATKEEVAARGRQVVAHN